mmetsp:Transcript_15682/g.45881  ORF Transcript_15682/g.45881 Transcript_15682/m.45881 type:complete len:81 (+) Transcript_15682:341-583(+)
MGHLAGWITQKMSDGVTLQRAMANRLQMRLLERSSRRKRQLQLPQLDLRPCHLPCPVQRRLGPGRSQSQKNPLAFRQARH